MLNIVFSKYHFHTGGFFIEASVIQTIYRSKFLLLCRSREAFAKGLEEHLLPAKKLLRVAVGGWLIPVV